MDNVKDIKRGICKLQLNSITTIDEDPTLLKATFSILDFEESGNKQIVPKELALEASPTLRLKPLLCQYFKTTDYEQKDDHFGGHGEYLTYDRDGNEIITTNTIAIGVANEGGYLTTIKNENGEDIEILACDFYLWQYRYPDICSLIIEIYESGLPLYSSCEYYYKNFEVNDGVQTIKSPLVFDGHCILQSNENNTGYVLPAYKSSKLLNLNERWNKAVAQAIQQNQNSQNENVDINNSQKEVNDLTDTMFKKVCELSFDDIKSLLYGQLGGVLSDNEYRDSWITETFETYFILSYWNEDIHKYYKVTYTKSDESVTIDWENRVEVTLYQEWREIPEVQSVLNELEQEKAKVSDLTNQVNTLTNEKESIEKQFNEVSEKITALNTQVEEMKPLVEKYNNEQVEKAINEKKDYYSVKFKAVNAMDKFESEEVQNLIKLSINDNQEGKDAILSLNTMLVDMVNVKVDDKHDIKELSSKNEKLIPTGKDFDSRYGE